MRIGIDIDDTITLTNEKLVEEAIKYDKTIGNRGFKNEESYYFKDKFYWNQEEIKKFFEIIRNNKIFFQLKERENSKEIINKLYEEGNEIYFITKRDSKGVASGSTKNWLKEHNYKYHKLFLDAEEKGTICYDNNIDIFIDNDINHINEVSKYNIKTILIETEFTKEEKNYNKKSNWDEIYNYIKEVEK